MRKLALIGVVIAGLAAAPAAQASQRDDYGNGMRLGGQLVGPRVPVPPVHPSANGLAHRIAARLR